VHVNGAAARAVVTEPQQELRAEVVTDLLAIETEWSALCDEARAGNVFLGPEWLVPWWKQFGQGREICSIAVRDGERLVGLLPLFRENVRAGGVPVSRSPSSATGDGVRLPRRDLGAGPRGGVRGDPRRSRRAGGTSATSTGCGASPTALLLAQRFQSIRPTSASAAGLLGPDLPVARRAPAIRLPAHPLTGTWREFLAGLGRRGTSAAARVASPARGLH
jgi:hypothetical protein